MSFAERFLFFREQMCGYSRELFASEIGVSPKTVERWESKKKENLPKGSLLLSIIKQFPDTRISLNWLMSGDGEPYPGATAKHPQLCGQGAPDIKGDVVSSAQAQPAPDLEPPNIGGQFMEDINHLKVIYDYEDLEIINAIHSNLRIFNRTVQREMEVKDLKQKVAHLEQENTALRARIDNLEAAVATLMAERETAQTEKKAINA